MVSVTIDGQQPDALIDVETGSQTGDLGKATIVVGDTQFNRVTFGSGDKVVVTRPNNQDWNGYVTGKPTKSDDGDVKIEALDTRYELKNLDIHRVFYDMDDGQVIREAVTKQADGLGRVTVHDGDSTTGWAADTPYFDRAELNSKQIHDRGGGLLFAGIPSGATGSYTLTFSNVPSTAIPGDGQVLKLATRLLVNDPGNQVTGEIELRDNAGNQYMWEVEYRGTDFNEYELRAADASTRGNLGSNGTLEYRFDISGEATDNIGLVVDWAATYPFQLTDRGESDISVTNVEDTGRSITRRTDKSALKLLQDLQTEAGFTSWLDSNDDLHFEQGGGSGPALQLVRGTTPVTKADFNTKYDTIDNKVTVQGAGDIQRTLRDPASIAFYGVAPRSEPLVDEEIQTPGEAEDRGRGYLEANAWNDTVATFTVADTEFQRLSKGDAVYVKWPPQSVDGDFVVNKTTIDSAGVVTLDMGVRV
jgi:hypothetical protein